VPSVIGKVLAANVWADQIPTANVQQNAGFVSFTVPDSGAVVVELDLSLTTGSGGGASNATLVFTLGTTATGTDVGAVGQAFVGSGSGSGARGFSYTHLVKLFTGLTPGANLTWYVSLNSNVAMGVGADLVVATVRAN